MTRVSNSPVCSIDRQHCVNIDSEDWLACVVVQRPLCLSVSVLFGFLRQKDSARLLPYCRDYTPRTD